MFENYPDILSISDLCKMLNIGKNSAYKLINSGDIKSLKIAHKHRIPKCYVLEYLQQAC